MPGTIRALRRLLLLIPHVAAGVLLAMLAGLRPQADIWAWAIRAWFAGLLRIMAVEVQVRGRPYPEACLRVANHISWLDIPVLGSLGADVFVAKSEVARWPVFGQMARLTRTIFLERGAFRTREATETMKAALNRGRSVLFFPEGTTGDGRQLLRFYPRLFAAAIETQAPVQPIALRYACEDYDAVPFIDDDAFPAHLWRLLRQPSVRVSISYARAFAVGGSLRKPACAEARRMIAARLEAAEPAPDCWIDGTFAAERA